MKNIYKCILLTISFCFLIGCGKEQVIEPEEDTYEERHIIDHSASEISTEDCAVLLNAVKEQLENEMYHFYVGTSYRHCLIWNHGEVVSLTPPHDVLTQKKKSKKH